MTEFPVQESRLLPEEQNNNPFREKSKRKEHLKCWRGNRSGQVWGHMPKQRVAALALIRPPSALSPGKCGARHAHVLQTRL